MIVVSEVIDFLALAQDEKIPITIEYDPILRHWTAKVYVLRDKQGYTGDMFNRDRCLSSAIRKVVKRFREYDAGNRL